MRSVSSNAGACWPTRAAGRVAVIVGHYPVVFPVNYALDEKSILYRTGPWNQPAFHSPLECHLRGEQY
jgi:hypothetical protein